MPNTLAHLGAQGILSRSLMKAPDPRWVLMGCLIPDLPWIANRLALKWLPAIDPYELRLYVIAQSSLLCSLLLCGALAAIARRWRPVFVLLAANSLGHLLIDACQTKWGNGVNILAPLDWHTWNLGLFWPESLPTYLLTVLGAGYGLWALRYATRHPIALRRPPWSRLAVAAALAIAYVSSPAILRHGPEAADSHSLRTLRERELRPGRVAEFDRAWLRKGPDGDTLIVAGGEEILVLGSTLARSGTVSARGRFVDPETLQLEEIHEHRGWRRDLASYLGLGIVLCVWGLSLLRPLLLRYDPPER